MARHGLIFGQSGYPGAVPTRSATVGSTQGSSSFARGGSSLAMLRKQYAKEPKPVEEIVTPLPPEGNLDVSVDSSVAAAEWDEVDRRTAEFKANMKVGSVVKDQSNMYSKITYVELESWLDECRLDDKEDIDERWKRVMGISSAGGKDKRGMDLVHCLSHLNFDFNNVVHFRILRTIYTALTRNAVCGRIGHHWEILGFQGQDPCTDINRSSGLMNVIHMFYFHSHYPDIFKAIFLLSQNSSQEFPFACVSINLTQTVTISLLEGRLTEVCSEESATVFETICMVYCASFVHFYDRWRTLRRTIEDFDAAKKEICQIEPEVLLQEFEDHVRIQ